jgi:hypothetical protein
MLRAGQRQRWSAMQNTYYPKSKSLVGSLLLCICALSSAKTVQAPDSEKFRSAKLVKIAELDSRYPPQITKVVSSAIKRDGCPADEIKLFRSRSKTSGVITISCFGATNLPPNDRREQTYISYPLTFVVSDGQAQEVDFSEYMFEYETGHIDAITDIDRNNQPEFWLSGATCECGENEDSCDCEGTKIRELRAGKLVEWKRER